MTATADIQPPVRPLYVGATVTRARDDKLLRGTEMFVSDVRLHDAAEMAIVRSPFAHAEIVSIDVTEARALPGVVGVWTAEDLHGISAFPDFAAMAEPVTMLPLATTKVRYVGMPVAVVVAEDRYIAEDAAELVAVRLFASPGGDQYRAVAGSERSPALRGLGQQPTPRPRRF